MSKAPAFQFYAQDFLTGVMYLTNEEKGIYITMLAKQWTDGKIPKKRLGFLVGIEWDNFSEELKAKFTDLGTHIINERLEIEREKKQKFSEKQSKNGKKGGRPKKKSKSGEPVNSEEKTQHKPNPFKNQNPNKNQKKPLEDEDRSMKIEDEKEKRKKGAGKKTEVAPEAVFPFDTKNFRAQWDHWKIYKRKEFGFRYKTLQSEQAALTELGNKADGSEKKAIAIMHQSMANGWKGFFELKNNNNGKSDKSNREIFESAMESEVGRNFEFK